MKKVALMTWHHTDNYGTFFQAYALKTLLEELGCHVELIDYRRHGSTIKKKKLHTRFFSFFKSLYTFLFLKDNNIFHFSPNCFGLYWSKYFTFTNRCTSDAELKHLESSFDIFVCGSDQIWGPEWFDGHFFLDFVDDTNKIFAYAPSLGVEFISDEDVRNRIQRLSSRFHQDKLSLRESSGCRLIQTLTGRSYVFNALDPVLLLGKSKLDSLLEIDERKPSSPYAFVFFLKNNNQNIFSAVSESRKCNLIQVVLHCTQSSDTEYANIDELTPGQLLYLLSNAHRIYTDSYHIMILALLYNVHFTIFEKENTISKNCRITDLLQLLNIDNPNSIPNWNEVNDRIEKLREKSFGFLYDALQ